MIPIDNKDFEKLVNYVEKNYGINLSKKRNLIEGRLSNTIRDKGFDNFKDYLDYVYSDKTGNEVVILMNKLTTNHTFFMREADHFEYLKKTILPYLKTHKRDRDLRIWSAACSTGEEPYTLAMIIDEFLGAEVGSWDANILATDISTKALDKAKKGIFEKEGVNKLPAHYKSKYFEKVDEDYYKVKHFIMKRVIYRKFNLMTTFFPFKKKFDVIFCRNVMIYFEKDIKMNLINKLYDITEKGGYLFIGQAESIPRSETKYNYIIPAGYRKEE